MFSEMALSISGFEGNLNMKRSAVGAHRRVQAVLNAHASAFDPEFLHFPSKDCGNNRIDVHVIVAVDPRRRRSVVAIAEPPDEMINLCS